MTRAETELRIEKQRDDRYNAYYCAAITGLVSNADFFDRSSDREIAEAASGIATECLEEAQANGYCPMTRGEIAKLEREDAELEKRFKLETLNNPPANPPATRRRRRPAGRAPHQEPPK